MFDKVSMPFIDIYDNKTNEYYGRVTFTNSPASDSALLGMMAYIDWVTEEKKAKN